MAITYSSGFRLLLSCIQNKGNPRYSARLLPETVWRHCEGRPRARESQLLMRHFQRPACNIAILTFSGVCNHFQDRVSPIDCRGYLSLLETSCELSRGGFLLKWHHSRIGVPGPKHVWVSFLASGRRQSHLLHARTYPGTSRTRLPLP